MSQITNWHCISDNLVRSNAAHHGDWFSESARALPGLLLGGFEYHLHFTVTIQEEAFLYV